MEVREEDAGGGARHELEAALSVLYGVLAAEQPDERVEAVHQECAEAAPLRHRLRLQVRTRAAHQHHSGL